MESKTTPLKLVRATPTQLWYPKLLSITLMCVWWSLQSKTPKYMVSSSQNRSVCWCKDFIWTRAFQLAAVTSNSDSKFPDGAACDTTKSSISETALLECKAWQGLHSCSPSCGGPPCLSVCGENTTLYPNSPTPASDSLSLSKAMKRDCLQLIKYSGVWHTENFVTRLNAFGSIQLHISCNNMHTRQASRASKMPCSSPRVWLHFTCWAILM